MGSFRLSRFVTIPSVPICYDLLSGEGEAGGRGS